MADDESHQQEEQNTTAEQPTVAAVSDSTPSIVTVEPEQQEEVPATTSDFAPETTRKPPPVPTTAPPPPPTHPSTSSTTIAAIPPPPQQQAAATEPQQPPKPEGPPPPALPPKPTQPMAGIDAGTAERVLALARSRIANATFTKDSSLQYQATLEALQDHLGSYVNAFKRLHSYLKARSKAVAAYAESIGKLPALGVVTTTPGIVDPIAAMGGKVLAIDRVEVQLMSDLSANLAQRFAKDAAIAASSMEDASSNSADRTKKLWGNMDKQQRKLAEALANVEHAFGPPVPGSQVYQGCPWLSLLKLDSQIKLTKDADDAAKISIRQAVEEAHNAVLRGSKLMLDITSMFMQEQRAVLAKYLKDTVTLTTELNAAAPAASADWQNFTHSLRLPPPAQAAAAQTAAQQTLWCTEALRSPAVAKIGDIDRNATFGWKRVVLVLTKFGYLHVVSSSDLEAEKGEVDGTFPLSHCTVDIKDAAKFTFVVTRSKTGLFNTTHTETFKAATNNDLIAWVGEIKKLCKK